MEKDDPRLQAAVARLLQKKTFKPAAERLYQPEGQELHWDGLHGQKTIADGGMPSASLSGPTPKFSTPKGQGAAGSGGNPEGGMEQPERAPQRPPVGLARSQARRMTPEEMQAAADAMMAVTDARTADANKAGGAAVGDLDDSGKRLPEWLKRESGR